MSCLKCLKYTVCVVNFIFFICGAAVFGLGVYLMGTYKLFLLPSPPMIITSTLFITGIIITCVSFLGFLGALKESRCLLMSFFILMFMLILAELAAACCLFAHETEIDTFFNKDLNAGLKKPTSRNNLTGNSTPQVHRDELQETFWCCNNYTDWQLLECCISQTVACPKNTTGHPNNWPQDCYSKLKEMFENNLLHTGIGVIIVCVFQVLGMCFSMTLFCHVSQSGLGHK